MMAEYYWFYVILFYTYRKSLERSLALLQLLHLLYCDNFVYLLHDIFLCSSHIYCSSMLSFFGTLHHWFSTYTNFSLTVMYCYWTI